MQKYNSNILKIIAIISMVLDHTAMAFFDSCLLAYLILRIIGRICAPVMFFGIARGYQYTSNKINYGLRLFIFAIISQVPYSLFISNQVFDFTNYNVIFTLFLSFMCLFINEKITQKILKYSLMIALTAVSFFCDWGIIGVVFTLCFSIFKDDTKKYLSYGISSFSYLVLYSVIKGNVLFFLLGLGLFLVIPILKLCNNQKGRYNLKYFFYIFYPSHLLVIYFLKFLL